MDNNLLNLSPASLRRAAQIKEQIDSLTGELGAILSGGASGKRRGRPPGDSSKAEVGESKPGRRRMSASARAKIAAAAKARWAKAKAAGKTRL